MNEEIAGSEKMETKQSVIDEPVLRMFIGEKNADYYISRWSKGNHTWNWAAFFFGLFWLGYRKMYKMIFLFLSISLLINLAPLNEEISTIYNNALSLGVAITLGIRGNYFYRQHAIKKIKKKLDESTSQKIWLEQVVLSGGGSWIGLLMSLLLLVVYLVLLITLFTFVEYINY